MRGSLQGNALAAAIHNVMKDNANVYLSKSEVDKCYKKFANDPNAKGQRLGQYVCNYFKLSRSVEGTKLEAMLWELDGDAAKAMIGRHTDLSQ